jgi:hypothetical protein
MKHEGSAQWSQEPAIGSFRARWKQSKCSRPRLQDQFLNINFRCSIRLGLPSELFRSGFPSKTFYEFLICPIRDNCPLDLIILILSAGMSNSMFMRPDSVLEPYTMCGPKCPHFNKI